MPRFVASLTCVLGLAALGLHARQGPPPVTFRSGVDLVDVDVSVLDRHRLPVRGLTSGDFTIFEDGQPRTVAAFTAVDLPPRVLPPAAWMADVAPDVQDNDVAREGRLVTILIDRNISFEQQPAAVRYAEAAVNQLRPGGGLYYLNFAYSSLRMGRVDRMMQALLARDAGVTVADIQKTQANAQLLDAELMLPHLVNAMNRAETSTYAPLAAAYADARVREAMQRLTHWDFSSPTGISDWPVLFNSSISSRNTVSLALSCLRKVTLVAVSALKTPLSDRPSVVSSK